MPSPFRRTATVKKPAVGQLLHERRNGQFLLQVTGAKLLTARIIESIAIVVVRIRVETLLADVSLLIRPNVRRFGKAPQMCSRIYRSGRWGGAHGATDYLPLKYLSLRCAAMPVNLLQRLNTSCARSSNTSGQENVITTFLAPLGTINSLWMGSSVSSPAKPTPANFCTGIFQCGAMFPDSLRFQAHTDPRSQPPTIQPA